MDKNFWTKIRASSIVLCLVSSLIIAIILSSLFFIGFLKTSSDRVSDALYFEEEPFTDLVIIAIDDRSINEIGRWPWSRTVFSDAISRLKDAKAIGVDVSFIEPENEDADSALQNTLDSLGEKVVFVSECSEFEGEACQKWLLPIFNVSHAAANVYIEHGSAVAVPSQINEERSLSKAISEIYLNGEIEAGGKRYIKFSRPMQVSFVDLLEERANLSEFEGKIVLIGATARNLHDEQQTPIGVLSGIEIHASAVQSIITDNFIEKQSKTGVILWIFLLSIITALIFYNFSISISAGITILLIIIYAVISIIMFERGVLYNLAYPISSAILSYFSMVGVYYLVEAKQRRWLSSVFGKYVSDQVAKEIMEKGEEALQLKGTKRIVTVLFADVRGFTSMSEKLPPEEVVSKLNKYLSVMTDVVFKHGGTLDKYVGDEIMATYNVPLDQKDHALAAVKTALEMQEIAKKLGDLKYGIGINTGPAVAGNIGSEKRLAYTVIGDSINLGARLCSKAEGHQIIISESTYSLIKDSVRVNPLGEITVKGKEKPIKVYEVLELKS